MYERNAIVIDRFFANLFGYNDRNNLKSNYTNYSDLTAKLQKYQEASLKEDKIMLEVENIANEIKNIKKIEESCYNKNIKLEDSRKNLFDYLDEDAGELRKKFEKIQNEIDKNDTEIKANTNKFIEKIAEFNSKSITRSELGKERRIVENNYQKILNITTENYNSIDLDKIEKVKSFIESNNNDKEKDEINTIILKNGNKEKVPFSDKVISLAIETSTNIEKKRLELLIATYDKTKELLEEIKQEDVKLDKHSKFINITTSKIDFLNAVSEYIILFLDNERMNAMGGNKEHKKLMDNACKNFESDLIQIKNLYELLCKETTRRANKKMYTELYKYEYLTELLEEEEKFEQSISKIKVMGTVIYPSYWRTEGMKRIFDTFDSIVTEEYGRDLSEFLPTLDLEDDEKENDEINDVENDGEENNEVQEENDLDKENNYEYEEDDEDEIDENEEDSEDEEDDNDRIVDAVLGFYDIEKTKGKKIDETGDEESFDFDWDDEENTEDDDIEDNEEDNEDDEEERKIKEKYSKNKRKTKNV